MKKKHSRIGLLASLAIHTALIGGTFAWLHNHKVEKIAEQNSLSMEMVAALLEQPQVAVAPDPITEEVKEIEPEKAEVPPEPKLTPEPTPEPEAIPDPTLNPKKEKPKEEKRKERHHHKHKHRHKEKREEEKPKDKPKERPKHHHKHIKALERGPEIKQGIVAKAIPNAAEGEKVVAGVVGGKKTVHQIQPQLQVQQILGLAVVMPVNLLLIKSHYSEHYSVRRITLTLSVKK